LHHSQLQLSPLELQLSILTKKICKVLHKLNSSIIRIALEVFKKNFKPSLQHVMRCQQLKRGDNALKELIESKMRLLPIVTGSNKRLIEQKNKEEERKNRGEEMKNKGEERRNKEGDKKNMNKECKRNNREEIKSSKEESKNNKEEEKSKSAKMKSIKDTLDYSNHVSSGLNNRDKVASKSIEWHVMRSFINALKLKKTWLI